MEEINDIKGVIAENIAHYRKAEGLTQSELAALLNYSDKAVSKWERAESVPDIAVLKQISALFKITLDQLTEKNTFEYKTAHENGDPSRMKGLSTLLKSHKLIIPILSAGLVWLIATVVFVFLQMFSDLARLYMCFVYALPVSLIVLIVFNAIWGNRILSAVIVSLLIWSIPLAVFLTINKLDQSWQLFLIAIPLQFLVAMWYVMRIKADKIKRKEPPKDTSEDKKIN